MNIMWCKRGKSRVIPENVCSISDYGIYFFDSDTHNYKLDTYKNCYVGIDKDTNDIIVVFSNETRNGIIPFKVSIKNFGRRWGVTIGCTKFIKDNFTFTNNRIRRPVERIHDVTVFMKDELALRVHIFPEDIKK